MGNLLKTILTILLLTFNLYAQEIISVSIGSNSKWNWTANSVSYISSVDDITLIGHFSSRRIITGNLKNDVQKFIRFWIDYDGVKDSVGATSMTIDYVDVTGDTLFYDCTTLQPNGRWTVSQTYGWEKPYGRPLFTSDGHPLYTSDGKRLYAKK